ncbi:hypothetical protein BH582_01790 [Vibrio sp. 10N.222.47.A9]|uniref:hypothetical protein n=1 Tax=Vibrio sp. 10N.222.47.A9 TaxID=1903178 RepID=UPI0009782D09|nr:hypothetical protein [Vibrio sp. 10N.222.47.A9]OMO25890.1 hypothetical protein BH582_01790 [Vibrio sp. 10N.222.47.A9]
MRIIILAFTLLVTACTSQIIGTDEHIESYIGSNIADAQKLYLTPHSQAVSFWESRTFAWVETQTPLENGETQHAFKNPYRDCTINWVVDQNGMIIAGSHSGEMCSP